MVFPFPVFPIASPPSCQMLLEKQAPKMALYQAPVDSKRLITRHQTYLTKRNGTVEEYNYVLSALFHESIKRKNLTPFLEKIQAQLPALSVTGISPKKGSIKHRILENRIHELSTQGAPFPMKVELSSKGMIQIYVNGQLLFISSERLAERIETKGNASIVGRGIRGLDPTSQSNWKATPLQREWPPSPQQDITAHIDPNQVLYFETPFNPDYEVKTSGMVGLMPHESSVLWAYEQDNQNAEKNWGAWTIAPFDVPQGKRVLNAYPVSPAFPNTYAKDLRQNKQWQYIESKGVVMVHPEIQGGFLDPFNDSTNWTLHAIEGNSYAIVLRTVYKEPFVDKAKSCMVEGAATYIENEFMGPKVPKGQKSIIACRLDVLPLSAVTGDAHTVFEKNRMDEQVSQVVDYLQKKNKMHRQAKE
jgi:hypothetical protein